MSGHVVIVEGIYIRPGQAKGGHLPGACQR